MFVKAEGVYSPEKSLGATLAGRACGHSGFWPWNLPRDNIHHATPKAFPKNTILYNSRSSKLDSLPANVAPRDYPGEYTPSAFTNIDSVKSNKVRGNYKECIILYNSLSLNWAVRTI